MKLMYGDSASRLVSGRIGGATATTALIEAIPVDRREDGMVLVCLDDYSLWVFEGASVAAASSTVLEPDDGDGRWVRSLSGNGRCSPSPIGWCEPLTERDARIARVSDNGGTGT